MKISIVTISYNQAQFLRECIDSVINQVGADYEYLVVDPGSNDGSKEIITSYKDRIDHVIIEPDDGPADGLNKGFSKATGDIYGYINADDYYLPGTFAFVKELFLEKPDVDVIYGSGIRIDNDGRLIRKMRSVPWDLKSFIYGGCPVVQQSTFFRKRVFESTNGFNVYNKTCWDGEILIDMALAGAKFGSVKRTLGAFRVYDDSISGSGRLLDKYIKDRQRMKRKVLGHNNNKFIDSYLTSFYRLKKWVQNPLSIIS